MWNNMIARCPYCHSIWVCWNWIHSPLDKLIELNPGHDVEDLRKTQWGHECWKCGDDWDGQFRYEVPSCWTTENKVTNGVPYWILKNIYGLPDIIALFYYRLKYRKYRINK